MSDRAAVLTAVAAWLGASLAWPIPRAVGVAVVVLALACQRPFILVAGVALLAAALGAAAQAGLHPSLPRRIDAVVELVADPVPVRHGVRVEVRVTGKRLVATADGPVGAALGRHVTGERAHLVGSVHQLAARDDWLHVRHVVGTIDVEKVDRWQPAAPVLRLANSVRSVLARGGDSLPRHQRPLYRGLVFGDDRGQDPRIVDDFRAAGLGHLLAVSGQNVALVLAAAKPLLERLVYRWRFPVTVALLALFVLVTRAEPSVLRAAAMAGGAALAASLGRQASSRRLLALAVGALVLVDPLLVRSLGFRLSVAASAGILVLGPSIAAWLRGPRLLVDSLSVTLGAQLATAPLLLLAFGGLPVAALGANVLAVPAAAPVMVWGVSGGVVAGMVGAPLATLLHLPTRGLLGWIELVSAAAGRLPLGDLSIAHCAVLALGLLALVGARRIRQPLATAAAVSLMAGALLTPALALRVRTADDAAVTSGVRLWQGGGATVVVVDGRARAASALAALRHRGVRHINLLVTRTDGRAVGDVIRALDGRYAVDDVWAPARHQVRGARIPSEGTRVRLGAFVVEVRSVDPRLEVGIARTHTRHGPR